MHLNEIKGMKLGLEAMHAVDAALGFPSKQFNSIHVGGTNGKGSVCWKIASGLQQAGRKVGLYTSPHLFHMSERIRINLQPIPNLELYLEKVRPFNLTFFETMTMAAFLYFADQNVDYGVIEVGLGGRLDATNIIRPKLAVITSIGFDHMEYLGDTLEKITFEKAGIIKEGIPALVGPTVNIDVEKVQGPFVHFEEENQAIAKRALHMLGYPHADVSITPPGRFRIHDSIVFDVAHNLPGLESLFKRLSYTFPAQKFRTLAAFSEGKDHTKMIGFLQQKSTKLYLTHSSHPRLAKLGSRDPLQTFEEAKQEAAAKNEILVVCGSHFIMEMFQNYF